MRSTHVPPVAFAEGGRGGSTPTRGLSEAEDTHPRDQAARPYLAICLWAPSRRLPCSITTISGTGLLPYQPTPTLILTQKMVNAKVWRASLGLGS